jgi:hypothetical protein
MKSMVGGHISLEDFNVTNKQTKNYKLPPLIDRYQIIFLPLPTFFNR